MMEKLCFPILMVSGETIYLLESGESFRRVLSLSSDLAVKQGFYRDARLLDSSFHKFRMSDFRLEAIPWWRRGWLKPRRIAALVLEEEAMLSAEEAAVLLSEAIQLNVDLWGGAESANALIQVLRSAETAAAMMAAFR